MGLLGTVGLVGAVSSHLQRHERRYVIIYVLLLVAAVGRAVSRFSLAAHSQSAALLLCLYTIDTPLCLHTRGAGSDISYVVHTLRMHNTSKDYHGTMMLLIKLL